VTKASDTVDLLNNVEVNCYGIMTPLPQLSTVTIKDASGNGRDFTSRRAAEVMSARPGLFRPLGENLKFNGTGAAGADAGKDKISRFWESGLDVGTGPYALEVFIVANPLASGTYCPMARDLGGSGSGQMMYLEAGGTIRFYMGGGGTIAATGCPFDDGRMHHVVCTRLGGTSSIYFDGASRASGASAGNTNRSSTICLGETDDNWNAVGGLMGYAGYYTAGLAAERVRAHYLAALADRYLWGRRR